MQEELMKYLPKEFITNHFENIKNMCNKLPLNLTKNIDILNCFQCDAHKSLNLCNIQFYLKRKDCFYCKNNITLLN